MGGRQPWYGDFMRAMAILLLVSGAAAGQVFEAASIKPGDPAKSDGGWTQSPGRISIDNLTLKDLVQYAWNVQEYQIAGGPKWLGNARFTIVAKMEGIGDPGQLQPGGDPRVRAAMKALLAERFQLVAHIEKKELSGYALVPAKSGFKLKPVEAQDTLNTFVGNGKATLPHSGLPALAEALSPVVERPVINETGIQGVYDIKLEWSPEGRPDKGPSLFTALQEQLGLRLEARKVPADIVVVDKAEKPGEN